MAMMSEMPLAAMSQPAPALPVMQHRPVAAR
jgi:hypothetical protein